MMKIRFLFIAILFFLLGGCSEGNRNTGSDRTPEASAEDITIIDNEDLSPGLKGIDADGNGIRDDIDRLIAKKYSATSIMRKVAEQKARALRQSMEATTREEAKAAGDEIFRALACAYNLLPHATDRDMKFLESMSIELEALTANTKERLKAYWAGQSLSSGMVFHLNQSPVCD